MGIDVIRDAFTTARNAAPSIPNATREELNTLRLQLEDLTEHSLTLEKERDFYFAKVSRGVCSPDRK